MREPGSDGTDGHAGQVLAIGMRRLKRLSRRPSTAADRAPAWRAGSRTLDAATCLHCGGPIEPGLATLGSISCHDCRQGTVVLRS